MALYNPFSRRQEVSSANVLSYKILTLATWLLSVIPAFYYTYHAPNENHISKHIHDRTLFGQSYAHPTPFSINHTFVSIYWIVMLFSQPLYVLHLFSSNSAWVNAACSVGPHFILFNIFNFAWIMLWTRSHFILSEIVLIINFLQLTSLYFRHSLPLNTDSDRNDSDRTSISTIKSIHIPAVSMPLVWTYFALFWNGSIAVHCTAAIPCRILANIAIWGIVPFAGTFLFGYSDWTVGLATAYLTLGLALGQMWIKAFALQWIFAFVIFGLVTLSTLSLGFPAVRARTASGERAPLLGEGA